MKAVRKQNGRSNYVLPGDETTLRRLRLKAAGFSPIPLYGKEPPTKNNNQYQRGLPGWTKLHDVSDTKIGKWKSTWSDADNSGILTQKAPALDIDILLPEAADAIETLARKTFSGGRTLVRIGQAPKRAILLRTDKPFDKLKAKFVAPDHSKHHIEILGDGQQLVVDGIHPITKQAYVWRGGRPGQVKRAELPPIDEDGARAFLADASKLLAEKFDFKPDNEDEPAAKNETPKSFDAPTGKREINYAAAALHGVAEELRQTAKGDRNDTLNGVAYRLGRMIARGWITRDVVECALFAAADAAHLVRDDGAAAARATVKSGIEAGIKEPHEDLQDKQAADVPGNLILIAKQWEERDLPPPDYICGEVLSTTSRTLMSADTGLGKSLLAIALGMRCSSGRDFLHWVGQRSARILYIDGEMSRRLLRQRLLDEVNRVGAYPDTFFALSCEDIPGLQPLNTEAGQRTIETVMREHCGGADFIMFDNIMALIAGEHKEEEGWAKTLPWVHDLTRRAIGQLWVHHTGHDASRQYGTKTREWGMDSYIHLDKIERPDTDVSFLLNFRKARDRTPDNREQFVDTRIALVGDQWTYETAAGSRKGKLSPECAKFLECLEIVAKADKVASRFTGHPTATIERWRAMCVESGLLDPGEGGKTPGARSLFSRHRRDLISKNWIACDETTAWLLP